MSDDPNLHALAWEASAQIAMAESNWTDGAQYLDRAFASLTRFDTPISAWRVYGTASELCRRTGQFELALTHRASALAHIESLTESLPPGEPLRDSIINAPAIRRIREQQVEVR